MPWLIFAIFVFGPCESLVPLTLASYALAGAWGALAVTLVFAFATVSTILVTVALLTAGVDRLPFEFPHQWTTVLGGVSLVVCGFGMQWLGW